MHFLGHNVLFLALLAANFGVAFFATWKGDSAVRWAAIVQLCNSVDPLVAGALGSDWNQTIELAAGLVAAAIYLLLAVRFANLWIGAAMLLQAAEFSLDSFYLVTDRPLDHLHAWINNTCEWGIVLSILLGAVLSINRRRSVAREAAELETLRLQRAAHAKA
jgi:hypothetical protein